MMPRLMPCSSSPPPGEHQHDEHVDHVGDCGFRLADADGFDEHHIEACCFDEKHRLARAACDAAQCCARRRRGG